MKKIITMLMILAFVLTALPIAQPAQAQTRRRAAKPRDIKPRPREAVGNSEYYNDDDVIFRSRKVFVSSVDITIGTSPEVPGGLKTAPGPDEEDVALTKRILIATRTSMGNIYIGHLNPVVNGRQVYVRQKKVSHKIIAIINCGNWARELAADYSFQCDTTPGACVPGEETTTTESSVSDDGKTKTVIVTTSDGCKTRIEKTITTVKDNPVCIPGSWTDVLEQGDYNGKLGKSFQVDEVIGSLSGELQEKIKAQVTREKVNYLFVQRGACELESKTVRARYFIKGKGMSKWIYFALGFGAGFFTGYIVRGTPDTPVPTGAPKIQTHTSDPRPLPNQTTTTIGTRIRRN